MIYHAIDTVIPYCTTKFMLRTLSPLCFKGSILPQNEIIEIYHMADTVIPYCTTEFMLRTLSLLYFKGAVLPQTEISAPPAVKNIPMQPATHTFQQPEPFVPPKELEIPPEMEIVSFTCRYSVTFQINYAHFFIECF